MWLGGTTCGGLGSKESKPKASSIYANFFIITSKHISCVSCALQDSVQFVQDLKASGNLGENKF